MSRNRKRVSGKRNKRDFSRNAMNRNSKNRVRPMRGGYRL